MPYVVPPNRSRAARVRRTVSVPQRTRQVNEAFDPKETARHGSQVVTPPKTSGGVFNLFPRECWPLFVISIRAARWNACKQRLGELAKYARRWDSVDARNLSRNTLIRTRQYAPGHFDGRMLRLGELGCYLSHVNCWKHVATCGAESAMIMEDDFGIMPAHARHVRALKAEADRKVPGWGVLFLYCATWHIKSLTPVPGSRLLSVPSICPTNVGYVIKREAAAALSAHAFPMRKPVDVYMIEEARALGIAVVCVTRNFAPLIACKSDTQGIK